MNMMTFIAVTSLLRMRYLTSLIDLINCRLIFLLVDGHFTFRVKKVPVYSLALARSPMASDFCRRASDFPKYSPGLASQIFWKIFPKNGKNNNSYFFGLHPLTVLCSLKLLGVIVISKSNPKYLIYYNYSFLLKEKIRASKILSGQVDFAVTRPDWRVPVKS